MAKDVLIVGAGHAAGQGDALSADHFFFLTNVEHDAGQRVHEGGLSGTGLTDDAKNFTRRDRQTDIIQYLALINL